MVGLERIAAQVRADQPGAVAGPRLAMLRMTVLIDSRVRQTPMPAQMIIEMIDLELFRSRGYQDHAHSPQLLRRLLRYLSLKLSLFFFSLWHTHNSGHNLHHHQKKLVSGRLELRYSRSVYLTGTVRTGTLAIAFGS